MRSQIVAVIFVFVLGSLGCALNRPARHVEQEGFLSDYSVLKKGNEHQAEEVYVAEGVDWKKYDKVLLDPVTIWRGTESRSRGLSHEKAQELANYFYKLIEEKFSQHFEIVSTPGPDTMRFQVAITKADETHVVLDVISTVVPQARAADLLQSLATGRLAFTGSAQVEARVTDTQTGEILAEGVDRRIGGKRLNDKYLQRWGDVENILQFWVDRSYYNLCVAQERTDCGTEPSNRLGTG